MNKRVTGLFRLVLQIKNRINRLKTWASLAICGSLLVFPLTPAAGGSPQVSEWNNSLAVIDAQIQAQGTSPVQSIGGQAAANIVPGVTKALLEQKRVILANAGFGSFAGSNYYSNFYSFTSMPGFTDTQVTVVETEQPLKLLRRGNHQAVNEIARGYLGSWWSGKYYSPQDTRNGLAILDAWGSDLQDIYVISVPAGTQLLGGLAAPMTEGDEYRPGGAYQYWKRSTDAENTMGWLVYALYAPDYLASYSGAIIGAQKLSRDIAGNLDFHMDELRRSPVTDKNTNTSMWLSTCGNDTAYNVSGANMHGQTKDIQFGWDRLIKGSATGEKERFYVGLVVGHGVTKQSNRANGVENRITGNYAGIYSLSRTSVKNNRSTYGKASLLSGGLNLENNIPGYFGYGLEQGYGGHFFIASMEHGVTLLRKKGLVLEPQVQLLYTRVSHREFIDQVGADVSVKSGDSLRARIGLEFGRTVAGKNGQERSSWLELDYIHEFKGRNTVDISGEQNSCRLGRNTYQINLGIKSGLNPNLDIQGEISKAFGEEQGYQGTLLLSAHW